MNGPPKKKRRLCRAPLQGLNLKADYFAAAVLANIFGRAFWFFEKKRTRLLDRAENERSDE